MELEDLRRAILAGPFRAVLALGSQEGRDVEHANDASSLALRLAHRGAKVRFGSLAGWTAAVAVGDQQNVSLLDLDQPMEVFLNRSSIRVTRDASEAMSFGVSARW